MIELAFSILASDFAHLADEVAAAERGGGTIVHIDVMDGHFVPNITFGPPMVKALRPITKLPLDCHLMIEDPDAYIPAFAEAGANMISVQQEVCRNLHRTLQHIAEHNVLPGVVINPATPVETLIEVLPMVHFVLVMSVNPGFGGQQFLPLAVDKIAHLARCAKRWASTSASRWMAASLTTRSPPWSRQERRCWSQAPPSSKRAHRAERSRAAARRPRRGPGRLAPLVSAEPARSSAGPRLMANLH